MRKFISDLWKGQLYNAARTHAGQPPGRKASYIQIAHNDLQRLDLFKPVQFLRIPHNQLPLLRLRTQATSYIPTHLHLSNINDDDCFYYHYWRNNVVIAFGTLSSFLT